MPLRPDTVAKIQDYARRYPSAQSAILPALWAVQYEQGYVTDEALAEVATHLKLPPSLIEATSSFYSMFLTRPEGRHEVMICVNAPCMLRGADAIVAYAEQRLGIRDGQTTSDGAITLRSTIECLGACGGAPMMQVDHRFEENLTPDRINAIFDHLRTAPAFHEQPPAEKKPARRTPTVSGEITRSGPSGARARTRKASK
ncbi:MAG: NADH-quinone oxidoreductase subunit NuoE [Chloroflexi bacterium]|nr:MAG: NADH-quinone oxidoreductase subunit NuoE [Chloroflexota bacterium]TMG35712.1 MAG: NADH-quinone oxidoreductase subunit NuoE [Chloroflexota bacterium]